MNAASILPSRCNDGAWRLLLPINGPYDWRAMMTFFGARALTGVEFVTDSKYKRSLRLGRAVGLVSVALVSAVPAAASETGRALEARVALSDPSLLSAIVTQLSLMFDVQADIDSINASLSRDPLLRESVIRRPGLRRPSWGDGFEVACRAILGQQITIAAARTLGCRLIERFGEPLSMPDDTPAEFRDLRRLFPSAERLADANLEGMGMPRRRAATLNALALATLANPDLFASQPALEDSVSKLKAIPGIGDWTAQYIALRALGHPDAFPAGDVALQNAAAMPGATRPTTVELARRSEAWRPWRAYAAQRLWSDPPAR